MSGASLAEVTVSHSNNRNAGYAADLGQLFDTEKTALQAARPRLASTPAQNDATRQSSVAAKDIFNPAWLDAQAPAKGDAQWACLAEAIYFEARGESVRGQFAVAEVILNRVAATAYPDSICGVVQDGAHRPNACQFSYKCDGKPETFTDADAHARAGKIARLAIEGASGDLTRGATHFHTRHVRPSWASAFPRTTQIGAHLFYRQPGIRAAAENRRAALDDRKQQTAAADLPSPRTPRLGAVRPARAEAARPHLVQVGL